MVSLFNHTTFSQNSWSESEIEIEMALLKYFAPSKAYLGYPRKLNAKRMVAI